MEARKHKETKYSYLNFLEELKIQLKKPLPGLKSQFELAPEGRINEYPDLKNLTGFKNGSVCIVIYKKNNEIYFPLIRRAEYKGIHSGQIALPGGKYEKEDINLRYTAIRETKEEIGIDIESTNVLGPLSSLYIPPSNYLVHPFVAYLEHQPKFKIQKDEVAEIIEYSLNNFLTTKINTTIVNASSNGKKIKTPYFDVNGSVLWGATAMILNEFKCIINSFAKKHA